MRGISTRQYAEVLPEMASTCGVSISTVSREAAEAGEEALQELLERRFDTIDLLVIYIDGMQFGEHHVISAVGVDRAWRQTCAGHAAGSDGKRGGSPGLTRDNLMTFASCCDGRNIPSCDCTLRRQSTLTGLP